MLKFRIKEEPVDETEEVGLVVQDLDKVGVKQEIELKDNDKCNKEGLCKRDKGLILMPKVIVKEEFEENTHVKEHLSNNFDVIVKREPQEDDTYTKQDSLGDVVKKEESGSLPSVSVAAAQAGLYEEHQVKDELVIGPEVLQPRDTVNASDVVSVPGPNAQPQRPAATDSVKEAFSCEICQKELSSKQNLVKHKRIHTGERPFTCDICHNQYRQKSHLIVHKRTHTGEKIFSCETCHKQFTQMSNLIAHRHVHTGEKNFPCETCHKQFAVKSDLVRHKRIHAGEKPYTCEICHKQYAQKGNLTAHIYIHTGERPFSCEICHKQYTQKGHLIAHNRIHTGEKPFSCDTCHKQFTQKCHLMAHKHIHTGEKPFSCEICQKQFTRISTLNAHKRVHTTEIVPIHS